jgi:hypothetical protein
MAFIIIVSIISPTEYLTQRQFYTHSALGSGLTWIDSGMQIPQGFAGYPTIQLSCHPCCVDCSCTTYWKLPCA